MSETRSLTMLSETDYDAIALAVMETSRGRWFMSEFARRNRHADTSQLLTAIGRIERAVGAASAEPLTAPDPVWREAAALIADLRIDLERISGRTENASSGLAQRIELASSQILGATEMIQEASWRLREAGGSDELCDLIDRRTTEIFGAAATVEGTAQQIGKIADTIAMLDSSLRALADRNEDAAGLEALQLVAWSEPDFDPTEPTMPPPCQDIELVEIGAPAADPVETVVAVAAPLAMEPRLGSIQALSDDIVFEDIATDAEMEADAALAGPPEPEHALSRREPAATRPAGLDRAATANSEVDLHAIDALPADRKLAYFA